MTTPAILSSPVSFACELLEALPEPICLFLEMSDLVVPNRAWRGLLGEASRFSQLEALVPGQPLREKVLALRGGESVRVPLDEGGMRHLNATAVKGHEGLFLLALRDDTEVRRVEQMRKDFIANVSHELRTPLTAVRGYIETLLDPQFMTLEHVQQFLPIIFEHTERLHNLMLDLLSLSRLESPDTHIELQPLSLAEELHDAVGATSPLAKMKQIELEVHAPADTVRVLANPEHLERVLVNLLDNAIKYSSPAGRVRIWVEEREGCAWTHVRDEGAGIAPEELPRVFERFYRTKGALGGKARGSGLGLAIVKHIVQQLGGEIGVNSTLGEGSDFFFSLRLALK